MSDGRSENNSPSGAFRPDEAFAHQLDAADPLASYRDRFHIPKRPTGEPAIYFCGNSLGLQPRAAREIVEQELTDWAELAVDGHFRGRRPWYPYHEFLREPGARLVGALPHEVVFMNGLTVNLHLLMVSLYRPTPQRYKILIEDAAFPSDTYAVRTQLRYHGFDPADALVVVKPRAGEYAIHTEDIEATLEREGPRIALVMMSGVNYFTGQVFDMPRITAAARAQGCIVGFDLAHAAGNIELALHDWDLDFAAWCTYKYLNSGPGAVAGCFLHERHARNTSLPRFGGWWGNEPATRFRMHLEPEFAPVPTADAWQLSNPPILSLAPVLASLRIFDEAGMPALTTKSSLLTGYLQFLLDQLLSERYTVITPREVEADISAGRDSREGIPAGEGARKDSRTSSSNEPSAYQSKIQNPKSKIPVRGCQLSILAHHRPKELHRELEQGGVVCDFREPNVVRVAPVPLYNTFHEAWQFAQVLARHV